MLHLLIGTSDRQRTSIKTIVLLATVFMLWGVWWGWPSTFDPHDPTPKGIRMLWDRTLDSGVRYWGLFAYQQVLIFAVVPVAIVKKLLGLDPAFAESLMYLMTRVLWALQGIGIVILGFVISNELFGNRKAALLSALLAILAPGLIAWSHIPQVDITHAFWYSVAAAFTAAGWHRGSMKLLIFAAVAAGLAAGVKYIGGLIVLAPMLAVFLLYPARRGLGLAIMLMGIALLVFFITTPLMTGAPVSDWLPGYTANVLVNQHREVNAPLAFWTLPGAIWDLIGPGTAILGLFAIIFACVPGQNRGKKGAWALVAAFIIPYYLILSWQHTAVVRYVVPLTAVLLVPIAFQVIRALEHPSIGNVMRWALNISILVHFVLVISLEIGLATDTRYRLTAWLKQDMSSNESVETILDHRPYFSGKVGFKVITRPHFEGETAEMMTSMDADTSSPVRKLHNYVVEKVKPDEKVIETWLHKDRKWVAKKTAEFDTSANGPVARGSKYVLMNMNTASFYVLDDSRIDPESPNEKQFFQTMLDEKGPYKLKRAFDPVVPEWLRYPRSHWYNISPPIKVFEVGKD